MHENILVAGGTGLIGSELLRALSERRDVTVTAIVRTIPDSDQRLPSINYQKFNFDELNDYQMLRSQHFTAVFLCLGTTRKKAGSAAAFVKVDLEYPQKILDAVHHSGPKVGLVSSVGADKPMGLYLNTKSKLETYLASLGLPYVVIRPSLLVGERKEFRFAEQVGVRLFAPVYKLLQRGLPNGLSKYVPVHARQVAHAMVHFILDRKLCDKSVVLQGNSLFTSEMLLRHSQGESK